MGIFDISTSVLILAQLLTLTGLALLATLFFFRRVTQRKKDLTNRLAQLSSLNKDTVLLLNRVMTAPKPEGTTSGAVNEILSQWLADTEAYLQVRGSDISPPTPDDPAEIKSAKLRYQLMLLEQQLYQSSQAPLAEQATDQFWQEHTQSITPIIEGLLPEPLPAPELDPDLLVMEKDDEDLHEKLTELRTHIQTQSAEIQNLKAKLKQKELYREQVLDCWGSRQMHLEQSFERLVKSTRSATNRNELHQVMNQLFNFMADIGESISGERIIQKASNAQDQEDTSDKDNGKASWITEDSSKGANGQIIKTGKKPSAAAKSKNSPNANIRKVLDKDVSQMKTVIIKQKSVIKQLRTKIDELEKSNNPRLVQEYEQQCIQLEQLLDENEKCIRTLEAEVTEAHTKSTQLEEELLIALEVLADYQNGDSESIRKLTEEQLAMLEAERVRLLEKSGSNSQGAT